jgi:S1-C subfamily serine protease
MKLPRIYIYSLIFTLIITTISAEEKKIKLRGTSKSGEFKPLQITISPDLLNIEKALELKSKYKVAKEFSFAKDKKLKKRKNIKFRSANAGESPSKIFKDYAKSVFFLYNEKAEVIGTGFLVDSSGLILSNWHVTDKTKKMFIWTLPDEGVVDAESVFANKNYYFGSVVAENKKEDLALIKAIGLPKNIKPVNLGSNDEINVGDNVYAIGHPVGLPWSFSSGMVSQKRKNYKWTYADESEHLATVVQMQTPISTGNSGGPLFSGKGKVVGVNTLMQGEGQNLNFAVAVDHVKKFIKDNPSVTKINPIGAVIKQDYPNAKTEDFNNNGIIDTWYIDKDNNGKFDLGFVDDDENGFVEGTLIDEDEDGVWEIFLVDTDENGKADRAYLDEDGDKKPDVLAYDYDEDGEWDKLEELS